MPSNESEPSRALLADTSRIQRYSPETALMLLTWERRSDLLSLHPSRISTISSARGILDLTSSMTTVQGLSCEYMMPSVSNLPWWLGNITYPPSLGRFSVPVYLVLIRPLIMVCFIILLMKAYLSSMGYEALCLRIYLDLIIK